MSMFFDVNKRLGKLAARAVIGAALMLPMASYAGGYYFTANTTSDTPDSNPGDGYCHTSSGKCSLRAAIEEGNALTAYSSNNYTYVQLPYSLYWLSNGSLRVTGDVRLWSGDYDKNAKISKSTTAAYRVFEVVDGGNLVLNSITVQHGRLSGDDTRGSCGGGILIDKDSRLEGYRLNVRYNSAERGNGGGICNQGILELEFSNISNNSSTDQTIGNPQVLGGGGIHNSGYANIQKTSIRDNTATFGAGIYTITSSRNTFDGKMGSLKLSSSSMFNNVAELGGAAIHSVRGDFEVANSTIVRNDVVNTTGKGAINIEKLFDYELSGEVPNTDLGEFVFNRECTGCHFGTPIAPTNYSFESLSYKIITTMNYFDAYNFSDEYLAESIAGYLIGMFGEGNVNAPFYELPKAKVWGSIIAQNIKHQAGGFYPAAYNCSTDDSTFSEDSGYNIWGDNRCDGANNGTDVELGYINEDKTNLDFDFVELDRDMISEFQGMWPGVPNSWYRFSNNTGVTAVIIPEEYDSLIPSIVPGLCPDYQEGCHRDFNYDATYMRKSSSGYYTPGSFQQR